MSSAKSPLAGHNISPDYRTKMMDWMVEVCTSFKCQKRTYFLSSKFFDQYLTGMQSKLTLSNQEVHTIGVVCMYLASKYEDLLPLHSKIVSQKIAHKAIPAITILKKEEEFLRLFEFQVEFATHYDFHLTYTDRIIIAINKQARSEMEYKRLNQVLVDSTTYFMKMAIQNVEFCTHLSSVIVMACVLSSLQKIR